MGFLGMMVDPNYGGGGMDTLSYVLAMEEISKVDSSCSVIMSVNNSLVWGLETYGTEEQNPSTSQNYLQANGSVHFVYRSRKLAVMLPVNALLPLTWVTITCSTALKIGLPMEERAVSILSSPKPILKRA